MAVSPVATLCLLLLISVSITTGLTTSGLTTTSTPSEECLETEDDYLCNCHGTEILQEVQQLDERVKSLGQSRIEDHLLLERKLDSLQELQQQMMTELQTQRDMMSAVESNVFTINSSLAQLQKRLKPKDCTDILREDQSRQSGVYTLFLGPDQLPVGVFCDMEHEGGGWMVFQRRVDGSQDFQKNWNAYARGFGDLRGEFWLGNDFLHLMTQQSEYRLRIDLEDFENNAKHAEYSSMTVASSSDKYRLYLGSYSGDAGDSMRFHRGQQFSTIDQDNDASSSYSCSSLYGKGGWWYSSCHDANLNGLYLGGANTTRGKGVAWYKWKDDTYSLKTSVMKLRPANY